MRALVTGAGGFVGARLARRLRDEGTEVRCLLRNPDGDPARALAAGGFDIHVADLTRPDSLAGAGAAVDDEAAGAELQVGGPDVLSYGEMLDEMALALGMRPRPKIPVPFLTPRLSSLWVGLVTPVDAGIARPLMEGLSTETVVTDDSARRLLERSGLDVEQTTLREALAEDGIVPAPERL